jgi:hypothetical protein
MNSTTKQIDAAMKRLDSDPALAADFDNLRRTEYPGKTRREAAALGLAALEARRDAALAKVRAKAMSYTANVAAKTFKKAVAAVAAITKPRADKRQAPLQISDWHTQHVMQSAVKGDQVAIAEIQRRGYEINTNNTFTKKA